MARSSREADSAMAAHSCSRWASLSLRSLQRQPVSETIKERETRVKSMRFDQIRYLDRAKSDMRREEIDRVMAEQCAASCQLRN